MVVPFSNRAVVATLPTLALASKPATVREVIEDFAKQCPPYKSALECVQLVKGHTLRICFPSNDVMEDIVHGGLNFRGHPLKFTTPSFFRWVTIQDLPYGIPESEIKTSLSKYGQINQVKSEVYMGLYTGTRLVKMGVKTAIPSRVTIAGHACTVFYRGQVRSCFRCGLPGHEAKKCPRKKATLGSDPVPMDASTNSVGPPIAPNVEDMSTTPPTSPRIFTNEVSGPTQLRVIGTPSPRPISPFPVEVLSLPNGPVNTAPTNTVRNKSRPYYSVTESEWTDSDPGERPRPRSKVKEPTITNEENIRDRSPLRPDAKSPTPNASVDTPSTVQPVITEEPPLQQTGALYRRPLSVRYREYCPTSSEYTKEEEDALVRSIIEVENSLASSNLYVNRAQAELQVEYDHLRLDYSIAVSACEILEENDPRLSEHEQVMEEADDALLTFEAAYPETVRIANNDTVPPTRLIL